MFEPSETDELSECTVEWQDYNDRDVIMYALLGNVVFAIPISYVVWKNPQLFSCSIWSFALPFCFAALLEISTGVASFVAKDRCKLAVYVAINSTQRLAFDGTNVVAFNETHLLTFDRTNLVAMSASYVYAIDIANYVAMLGGFSLLIPGVELLLWLLAVVALCTRRDGTNSLPQDATLDDHQWELLGDIKCRYMRGISTILLTIPCIIVTMSGNPLGNFEVYILFSLYPVILLAWMYMKCCPFDARNRYRLLRYGILDVGGFILSFLKGNYITGSFVFLVDDIHGAWTYYQDTMVVSKSRGATGEDEGATASEEEGLAANEDAAATDGAKLPNV